MDTFLWRSLRRAPQEGYPNSYIQTQVFLINCYIMIYQQLFSPIIQKNADLFYSLLSIIIKSSENPAPMAQNNDNKYELTMNMYNMRFKPMEKVQDLFGREYLICWDEVTHKKVISKNYSVQTHEQKEDVRQNMANFIKLSTVPGISQLVAYAEEDDQLRATFECDGTILSKYIEDLLVENSAQNNRGSQSFCSFYIMLLKGLLRIVGNTTEIGMQMDDISRDNIIISQPNYVPSSSSIQEDLTLFLRILYDERQKDYEFLLQPNLFPERKDTKRYPNKLYWSSEKIFTQIISENDYWSEQGMQSIYQIGLLLLDVIYECETSKNLKPDDIKAIEQLDLLNPDASLINIPQRKRGYYIINKVSQTVERDQAFIAHKLNYLINQNDQPLKYFSLLIRNMISQVPQMRYDIEQVQRECDKIEKLINAGNKPAVNSNTQHVSNQNLNGDHKQIINSYESENSRNSNSNFLFSKQFSEGQIKDSLKYSENSLSLNEQLKFGRNEPAIIQENSENSFHSAKKEIQLPLSSTTLTQSPNKKKNRGSQTLKQTYSNQNIRFSEGQIITQQEEEYHSQNNSNHRSNLSGERPKNAEMVQSRKVPIDQNKIENAIWSRCQRFDDTLKRQLQQILLNIHQLSTQTNPSISVVHKEYSDGSFYYGCIDTRRNKRSGPGIYLYKVGDIYFGNWIEHALPEGVFIFRNGESYIGPIRNGKQGEGEYRYANGNIYSGGWKDDLKDGKGVMNYGSGAKYQGQWVKGKKHGIGTYYYENGLIYEGGFVLGKKYGNGVFIFTNGTKIRGFWQNNCFEGKAIVEYYNGDRFQGTYHQSEKAGEGQYSWKMDDGEGEIIYRGEFKKDNLQGKAVIQFQNGQKYEGSIKNGKREGEGKYLYRNGDQFIGIWKQDKKQMGKYIFSSGEIFEGRFRDGQMSYGLLRYMNGDTYQGQFQNGERHGAGNYSNKDGKIMFEGRWNRDQFQKQI